MSATNAPHPLRRPYTADQIAAARASVAPLRQAIADRRAALGSDATVLAWMSDLHIHARRAYPGMGPTYSTHADCSANLALALAEVDALAPDLLLFGGDLADSGCAHQAPADEYAELGAVLTAHLPAALPSLAILGNHDHSDRDLTADWHDAFRAIARPDWPAPVESADVYFVTQRSGWRFIGLDTRQNHALSERQRTWFADTLAADRVTPTVILQHRPHVTVGNWVDDHRLRDRPSLDLVRAAPNVRLLLSGHTHCPAAWTWAGQVHVVFPALAYGIGAAIGWGVVVLADGQVDSVFIKDLAGGAYYDQPRRSPQTSGGYWRPVPTPDFTLDMLFNPCTMPT